MIKGAIWRRAVLATTLTLGTVTAGQAAAQTYSTVNLTPYANDSWSGTWGVSSYPTGAQTLDGHPFQITSDANGARYASAYQNTTNIISIVTDVVGATNAYSLINTIWGQPGPNSYLGITFTGALGFSQTFDLVGDIDIRDFNNYAYTNTINGTTGKQVVSVDGGQHRLDEQSYALDSEFLKQNLVGVTMTDTGADGFSRGALTGLTFQSAAVTPPVAAVPEPASWAMMIIGFGLIGAGLRYRQRRTVPRYV